MRIKVIVTLLLITAYPHTSSALPWYDRDSDNIFQEMSEIHNQMDSFFDSFIFNQTSDMFPEIEERTEQAKDGSSIKLYTFKLPNIDEATLKKNVTVQLDENVLIVSMEDTEDETNIFSSKNRIFSCQTTIPDNAIPKAIRAFYKDGLLIIQVPLAQSNGTQTD